LLRSLIFLGFSSILASFSSAYAGELFKSKPDGEKQVQMSSIFTNDFLGDGKDRWRTGSLDVSLTFGGGDLRELPSKAWERYQVRLRSEIIAPASLTAPAPTDRRYAGVLGLGLFTHFQKNQYDLYYGGELVFVGDATGVGSFQKSIHNALNITPPSAAVLNNQIPNAVYPTFQAGISKSLKGAKSLIRPFAEVQAGAETFVRLGADAIFGTAMINDFLLRDSVSGQLISHSKADSSKGFGFLIGADAAYVADSNYLPNSGVSQFKEFRPRARVGMIYQTKKFDAFYGATWLGKEFDAQTDSQVVGSLNFRVSF
jgi:outer membrane protein LpxR